MALISISDLKMNTGKYVAMAVNEDIFITRHGKMVARITTAQPDKTAAALSLFGILPKDVDLDAARAERLK